MEVIANGMLIGSLNGSVVGGATLVTGKKGFALHANGVNQYVDFGYKGDTCLGYFIFCTRGWIAAFWVQSRSDRFGSILDTGADAGRGINIYWRNGSEVAVIFRAVNKAGFMRSAIPTHQGWFHVVVSWIPCHIKLYFDGGLVDSRTFPSSSIPSTPVTDAQRVVIGATCKYRMPFNGSLDELRVWDAVLDDGEALALYRRDSGLN